MLDPDTPAGRSALANLVEKADIVIEASRPRALAGFGLDAETAVAAGTTWVSITAAGRNSPRIGFGDDIAASSGLVAQQHSGLPVFVGDAIADPLAGLLAAALAMSEPLLVWDIFGIFRWQTSRPPRSLPTHMLETLNTVRGPLPCLTSARVSVSRHLPELTPK
ncbi:hypothetical protein GCM10020255_000720 [Rhodococcus baikonurensis]